jgi:hypothetical protein
MDYLSNQITSYDLFNELYIEDERLIRKGLKDSTFSYTNQIDKLTEQNWNTIISNVYLSDNFIMFHLNRFTLDNVRTLFQYQHMNNNLLNKIVIYYSNESLINIHVNARIHCSRTINNVNIWKLIACNLGCIINNIKENNEKCDSIYNKKIEHFKFIIDSANNIDWKYVDRMLLFPIALFDELVKLNKILWQNITYLYFTTDRIEKYKKYINWRNFLIRQNLDGYVISKEIFLKYHKEIIEVLNENVVTMCNIPEIFLKRYSIYIPDDLIYFLIKHQSDISNYTLIEIIKSRKSTFNFDKLYKELELTDMNKKVESMLEMQIDQKSFENIIQICRGHLAFSEYKMSEKMLKYIFNYMKNY